MYKNLHTARGARPRTYKTMQGTIDIETIRSKRWFMGRNRPVSAVHVADSASIGDTEIVLLNVSFADGEQDKYAIIWCVRITEITESLRG